MGMVTDSLADRPQRAGSGQPRREKSRKFLVQVLRSPSFLIRFVYAICLAGAFYNHARIVAAHGLEWNYGGLPMFVCVFWTALTFIDALAATIIVCDVAINSWVAMTYGFDIASYVAQALFLVFVLSTLRIAWRAESGLDRSRVQ